MSRYWNGYRWVDQDLKPRVEDLPRDSFRAGYDVECCARAEHGDGTHDPTCPNFRGVEAETAAAAGEAETRTVIDPKKPPPELAWTADEKRAGRNANRLMGFASEYQQDPRGLFDTSLIKRADTQPIGTVETMDGLWIKTECEHRTAYSCVACKRRMCMQCDALLESDGEYKTAVRWCPAAACVEAEAKENGISVERMLSHRVLRGAKCVVCEGPHDIAKHEAIVARRRPTATTKQSPTEGDQMDYCKATTRDGYTCTLAPGHAGEHSGASRVDRQSEATPFDLGDVESERAGDSAKKKDSRNG